MNRMRVRLWLLVMLVLLVGPGLVHARPATEERTVAVKAAEPSALGRTWGWIVSIFGKVGSFIDPLGGGESNPSSGATSNIDVGSFIDPLGGGK
jgi:hypothetical protein